MMKKLIITVVLGIISSFSFANEGLLTNNHSDSQHEKLKYSLTKANLMEISELFLVTSSVEIVNNQITGSNKNLNHSESQSLISKTISVFGSGINMAGFNVKMNKLNLVKGSGWVHQKECNLHPDITNNGLSIRYKF